MGYRVDLNQFEGIQLIKQKEGFYSPSALEKFQVQLAIAERLEALVEKVDDAVGALARIDIALKILGDKVVRDR